MILRFLIASLIALEPAGAALAQTTLPATDPSTRPSTRPTSLREAAGPQMLVGAALMSAQLDSPAQSKLIAQQFDCLTGENEFKVLSIHPQPAVFKFAPADKIVSFAEAHGMKVIGHNLLWHQHAPKWMFNNPFGGAWPRERALDNLHQHIDAVVKHFKGHVIGWDVVNEAIPDGDGELRDTPARRAIGDDYIERAFEFAHAADPDAELYYNDYNIDAQPKRDKAIKIIRRLKAKGIRIDAVGIQGHWGIDQDAKSVDEAIAAFQAEGVKVMITELDLDVIPHAHAGADIAATQKSGVDPYKRGLPDDVQRKLADTYSKLFQVFKERGVTRVTFWGAYDGQSWLNDWPVKGRTNYPLLFDRNLKPKPAYEAVIDVLSR